MSKIKVNSIINKLENGPVEFSRGLTIDGGVLDISSSLNVVGVMTVSSSNFTNANVTGVMTATSYKGDGSNLTSLPITSVPKIFGFRLIFSYNETFGT
jgi:hypothetical protein